MLDRQTRRRRRKFGTVRTVPESRPEVAYTLDDGSSLTELCPKCEKLDFSYLFCMTPSWLKSLRDLGHEAHYNSGTQMPENESWTLREVEKGPLCAFCRLIHDIAEIAKVSEKLANPRSGRITFGDSTHHWLMDNRLGHPPQTEALLEDAKDWQANFLPVAGHVLGCARRLDRQMVDMDLIKKWISTCIRDHGEKCNQPTLRQSSSGSSSPQHLRVIDVENSCITEAPKNCIYLALSYVWGGVQQNRLSREVLREWTEPGGLLRAALSKTISDAMFLTQKLGYQFLWVDSVCIVQNDPSDRMHQIQQMHCIYDHALLTIIAASGENCSDGIAGIQGTPRIPLQALIRVDGVEFASVHVKEHRFIDRSTWNTRGWTFQENMLSRRTLTFTNNLVTFACSKANWREDLCLEQDRSNDLVSESGPSNPDISLRLAPLVEGREIASGFQLKAKIQQLREPKSEYESGFIDWAWYGKFVDYYLRRHLSDENDILDAFNGVAEMLKPYFGAFLWGLPECSVVKLIGWKYYSLPWPVRRAGFPSWSWAGWRQLHPSGGDISLLSTINNPTLTIFSIRSGIHEIAPLADSDREDLEATWSRGHFLPDIPFLVRKREELVSTGAPTSQLIAFTTSSAKLKLVEAQRIYHHLADNQPYFKEYSILGNQSNEPLSEYWLPHDTDLTTSNERELIVISHKTDSFELMTIEWHEGIAYRIYPMTHSIPVDVWWSLAPEQKLIVLG